MTSTFNSLRRAALLPLCTADAFEKAQHTLALRDPLAVSDTGANENLALPLSVPGRPERPHMVPATSLQLPSLREPLGRAALIHSIVHIEFNAINLALDIACRFSHLPDAFYRDWIGIAIEEAEHFLLLRDHLASYGYAYGDFNAHNGLWDMAERTADDLLARIALVPRTLEARGLDASPQVKKKLIGAGDVAAGPILDRILHDEVGHVAAGNRWYRWLCAERGLDPLATYPQLVARYAPPPLRGPFNLEARRQAGFEEAELQDLLAPLSGAKIT